MKVKRYIKCDMTPIYFMIDWRIFKKSHSWSFSNCFERFYRFNIAFREEKKDFYETIVFLLLLVPAPEPEKHRHHGRACVISKVLLFWFGKKSSRWILLLTTLSCINHFILISLCSFLYVLVKKKRWMNLLVGLVYVWRVWGWESSYPSE